MSRKTGFRPVVCGLLGLIAAAGPGIAQAQPPVNEQEASAGVLVINSKLRGGGFGLSGVARVCGEMPKELNFAGVPIFNVTFYPDPPPPRGTGEITNVTFDSKELVGGRDTSNAFFLSLTLQSTAIGSPPALVVDTSKPGNSGTAKLSRLTPGLIELIVEGKNVEKEDVRLRLYCGADAHKKPVNPDG